MTYTYEDVSPSLIPNTVMQKRLLAGVHRSYTIKPLVGYKLHDKPLDYYKIDGAEPILGFTEGTCTCGAGYDFTRNNREFYSVKK